MHYPFSSHKVSRDSSLPQPAIGFSHGTWVGTPGSSVSCLCTLDVVKDTRSKSQSNLANCPVHPAANKTDIFASSDDFLHANQYDQWAYPVAQTHVLQGGAQHQKYQSRDSPSRIPQPPTFLSAALPPAQSSLAGDHAGVDLRSTEYSRHSMPGGPIETFPEDGNVITSEHMCDSEHWQHVSRTTFGIEAQTCDGAESDTVASELPVPISINPLNDGIVTDEVKSQPHPVPHITSVSQIAGDGGRGRTRVTMQESTLERKPIQENRVAVTASSQTTSTEKFTPVVPCRETLVTEECAPLSTVTYTPSLPPSRRQSSQTFSYSNDSGTDDKLHRHREYADSSTLACASVAPGENNNSTPTRSIVIAVDNTQKPSSASNDLRNPSFIKSTLTIGESHPLAADRHGELCGQDVVRDRPSQVSPTPKLEDEEENVSTYRKRQTVEGREDYERGTEREVKPNLTSYSRTVRISQGYTPESAISNDDRRMNEGADGAALSLSSISPGFKQSSFSEPGIQQDLGTNRIQTECEHRTSDVDTVSKSSVQISSHHSTESSEGHIQRQGREEVDSSVLARVSLAPVENNAAPVSAPRRAVENTQKPSLASNDLQNSSLLEDTWTMGQTSSSVTSLKGRSCGQIAGRDLLTQSPYVAPTLCLSSLILSSTPNVEHDKVPVSAACIHQDPEDSKDYHAQETESDVTLKLKSYPSAVRSLRQSESATVLNAGGRTDEDTDSVISISSLSSTNSGRKLSLSEPGVPQDARTNHIQSACEHQSSEINVVSTTLVQTSSHHSIENRSQSSSRVAIQGGPCGQDTGIDVLQVLESNTTPPQSLDVAVENTETSSPAPDDLRNSPPPEGTSTIGQTSPSGANLQEARGHDVDRDRHSSRGSSITKFEDNKVDVSAGTVHQALVTRGDYHERETESKVEHNLTYHSCTVEMLGQSSTTVTGSNDRQMDKDADGTALPLPTATTRPKLSNSEPDIPQDAATTRVQSECMTQSSNVITVSTTSMQTSSHSSTVSSEDIRQQPALASSHSKEPAIDDKVNKATAPVHQLLAPGEHNSTLVQPIDVAAENTQQSGPASNDIRNSSLLDGASTTGQTSSSAYHVCGEPCGPDVTRDPPNQYSSSPKLKDDKEKISADYTCQATEGTRNYKSDTTDERETMSQVEVNLTHDFRLVTIPNQTVTEPVMSNDDRRMNEDAEGAVLISPSPNPESKGSPSEPSVPQDAATDHVQSGCEHHYTKDITVSVMSVRASSNCLTDSSKGYACLDNPSQQSNNHPDTISVLPMPGGPYLPPPVCYEVHDFGNCSCVSPVIASAEGDSTTVVATHPAPCAEGAASVKSRQDDCMHPDPAVISPTHAVDQRCNSSTVQTPCQTENQDNTSCADDRRPCCTQEPADVIVSALSVSDACGTLTPNDCPSVDDQSTHNAASDCACVPPV
ncbi:hypothetical protein EDB19DRAFT_1743612 [Suillus lakei]|nr:hypothetical protein EDB19DRAFT_1743612 [Suillus lakei]